MYRRLGFAVLVALVIAALIGVFGAATGTVRARAGETELTVTHPARTRSSVAAPMRISVRRRGGFGTRPVTVAIDHELLSRLDFQNWYPNPSAESNDPRGLVYEFDPPAGDELVVELDARVGPNQWFSSRRYRIAVMDGERPTAEARFRMTVWP